MTAAAFFEPVPTEAADASSTSTLRSQFLGGYATSGPWSPDLMHAGPPSALIARQVELASQRPDFGLPVGGFLSRISIDIHRPVPVGSVQVDVTVLRGGARVGLAEVQLTTPSHASPAMTARVWVIRRTTDVGVPQSVPHPPPPQVEEEVRFPGDFRSGYLEAMKWFWSEGRFGAPGPVSVWSESRIPLIAGEDMSGVQRVMLLADSGNGISARVSPGELIFVNTDLTVHLHRNPVGPRVWMRSQSYLEAEGVGLVDSALGDETGSVGTAAQSLFVAEPER